MIVLIPFLALVGFYAVYEFYALFTGRKLVTTYVREASRAAPGVFMVSCLVLGILIGHFVWFD